MAGPTGTIDIHGVQYPECGFSRQLQEFLGGTNPDPESNWFEKLYQNIESIFEGNFGITNADIGEMRRKIQTESMQRMAAYMVMNFEGKNFKGGSITTDDDTFKKQWLMANFFMGIAMFMFADPTKAFPELVTSDNPFFDLSFCTSSGNGSVDSRGSLQEQLKQCTLHCSNTSSSGSQKLSTLLLFSSLLEKPSSSRTPAEKEMMQEVYAKMGRRLNA
eukprot:CAMPEP_0113888726 /NCGR_PEP_ID=MMETSP0780_2-20120614/13044_1 /TAXON_ID=652834 /ORGANISM="Palpitomonas bilix" /LENGTH=217 /DNA_ID=CAMNT_0000877631 /DNA_START=482 /DNA_END=1135 /DNA_ORIENTATION=+ /assembly_acc=CAM_ASM_000599